MRVLGQKKLEGGAPACLGLKYSFIFETKVHQIVRENSEFMLQTKLSKLI